jgi:hypothetical protein
MSADAIAQSSSAQSSSAQSSSAQSSSFWRPAVAGIEPKGVCSGGSRRDVAGL